MKLYKMPAIVSHDAGGAEILSSWVLKNKIDCRFVLEGPAVNIFNRKLGNIELISLDSALAESDWLLCGTGWQSDLEWLAIKNARKQGKYVIAFLDHWINYKERFIRGGIECLPDEIWVGDEEAEQLVHQIFPGMKIQLVPNPYFDEVQKQLLEHPLSKSVLKPGFFNILYVCENTSSYALKKYGNERYFGYTELDAIEFFFEKINLICGNKFNVVIRPHPSDAKEKYNQLLDNYPNNVILSEGFSLISEIANSDVIVGCESMAMVIGLMAKKKVVSCIPIVGRVCRLPHEEIICLSKLALTQEQ